MARWTLLITLAALLGLTTGFDAGAKAGERVVGRITLDDHDFATAAAGHTGSRCHLLPRQGAATPEASPCTRSPAAATVTVPHTGATGAAWPRFYPDDVSYGGGAVIPSARIHDIYVNCSSEVCWGDPAGFQSNLFKSSFRSILDQYVGVTTTTLSYSVGTGLSVATSKTTLIDSDIQAIVVSAAGALKIPGGYSDVFHVFLPKGMAVCFDSTHTQCYSPNDPSTFVFCGYHGSFNDSGNNHRLYTVEPYENVPACNVSPPYAQSELKDATNSVLSHELFETLTDPDPYGGWAVAGMVKNHDSEIGDLCVWQGYDYVANGVTYRTQLEYSNTSHACVSNPP
jgi:hypothetical protein